jgi:hypothetical protein
MKKHVLRTKKNKRGGGATNLPAPYFKANLIQPDAPAGSDLLRANVNSARPRIGGGNRKKTRKTGGFVPSVMGGFVQAASKYITPIALFAGYKLLTRKSKKSKRRQRK